MKYMGKAKLNIQWFICFAGVVLTLVGNSLHNNKLLWFGVGVAVAIAVQGIVSIIITTKAKRERYGKD